MIHKLQFGTKEYEHCLMTMKVGDIIDLCYGRNDTNKEWIRVEERTTHGYRSVGITTEVCKWMDKNEIGYPFTKEEEFLFLLTFG